MGNHGFSTGVGVITGCVMCCIFVRGSFADEKTQKKAEPKAASGAEKGDGKGGGKETPATPELDLSKLKLPRPGYAEKLRGANTERKDSAGVTVDISSVPDAFLYYVALGVDELNKASYSKVELAKKLKELVAKNRKYKNKALFFLTLNSSGGNDHHFLQSAIKDHVALKGEVKMAVTAAGDDPKPAFASWRVFEQRADQRNVLQKKLSEFTKFSTTLSADHKENEKAPLTLSIKDLVRVTDRREEQKTDYRAFEGINVGLKQISSSDWKSQMVPEIVLKLYPGRWLVPEQPPELKSILEALDRSP